MSYQVLSGRMNMALDHYLAVNIKQGENPILRFYGWQPFCLSLGFHQKTDGICFDRLHDDGFTAVRRPTGGSAIFHSHELTYSLIIPGPGAEHHFIYQEFHKILAAALKKMGYNINLHEEQSSSPCLNKGADSFACFNRPAFTEIKFNGRKLVGSAQKIYPTSLLQHGSILIGRTQDMIIRYISDKPEKLEKYDKVLKNSSICLQEIIKKDISPVEIAENIIKQFAANGQNSIYYQSPAEMELEIAGKGSLQFDVTK